MASQSVLELAVNTGKWDSGLKKAKSALDNFTTASGGLQQALGKDSDKMQKFVQMMGSMESKAKTAKGQMNDYKGTIEQLTMQYNRMTDAQQKTIGQDYLRAIDQLRQKYQAVNQEVQQMNRNLSQATSTPQSGGISSVNPFGNLTSKFTKANIYAMAAEKGVEAFQKLGSHIVDVMGQAQKLSAESEGIRNAFERLNRPDLLDNLREATHGTVSDLELMKQAVKFSDFKLSLDDLGTLLAFAQQKAKDTGQSVDYMVDSIVTGLGRKSLMILDNLGLSASEIKDRMKETGDMTKAVAGIIRDQIQQAGEYTETASDRLARAIADNENAMLKLGDAMRDTFGAAGWDEMAASLENNLIVELTEVVKNLGEAKSLINDILGSESGFGELASTIGSVAKEVFYWGTGIYNIWRLYNKFKGEGETPVLGSVIGDIVKKQQPSDIQQSLSTGNGGKNSEQVFGADTIGLMEQYISDLQKKWKAAGEDVRDLYAVQIENARNVLARMKGEMPEGSLAELNRQMQELRKEQSLATNTAEWKSYEDKIKEVKNQIRELKGELGIEALHGLKGVSVSEGIKPLTREDIIKKGQASIENFKLPEQKESPKMLDSMNTMASGMSQLVSGMQQIGITIPQEIQSVIGILQGITTILTAIQTINSIKFWAGGGVVHANSGLLVPGNHFSGDMVPSMINSGELILNKAQQGNLASQLMAASMINGGGGGGSDYVSGQNIYLGTNNYLKGSGHGQLVTTRMLRQYGLIS